MSHVFISYAHEDLKIARRISDKLKQFRQRHFLDVDVIKPGNAWQSVIDEGLRTAHAVLVILTRAGTKSEFVTYEWAFALGAGIKVIPVLAQPRIKMHSWLQSLQYFDLTTTPIVWRKLVSEIGPAVDQSGRATTTGQAASSGPRICAKFATRDGKLIKKGSTYRILVRVKGTPAGTRRVDYEIHDTTFDQSKWSVTTTSHDFEDWIETYGDVFISAKGGSGKRRWRIQSSLTQALRNGYDDQIPRSIQAAFKSIENN